MAEENLTPRVTPGGGRGSVPVPDPTLATSQALNRELELLAASLDRRFAAIEAEIAREVHHRSELIDQQLAAVNLQFSLVERQRQENKLDTKLAVDAALQAQKEAVREQTTASERAIAKSETATNKQLEQLALTFATSVDALRRSIEEGRERIGELDRNLRAAITDVSNVASAAVSERRGAVQDRTGLYAAIGIIATLVFLGIAIAAVFAARGG